MRNQNKKVELAKKNNSRVILCNTPETKILIDIAIAVDKIFKHIRTNAGIDIAFEDSNKYSSSFQFIASNLEVYLSGLTEELDLPSVNKSFILKQILELKEKSENK